MTSAIGRTDILAGTVGPGTYHYTRAHCVPKEARVVLLEAIGTLYYYIHTDFL